MKRLFLINDSTANKISYYHLLFLLASLPFDFFYSHVIIISFAVHTIIQFKKQSVKAVFNLQTLLLMSVFLITVLSTVYSPDKPAAFNEWGRQVTILLFPLLFALTSLDVKKYRQNLLLAFSMVCTLTVAYLYINVLYIIRFYHLPLSCLFSNHFSNHNFSDPIGMHATFFSLQVAIAFVFMISGFVQQPPGWYKGLYFIGMGILLAGLVQLGAKSVIVCLFIIINLLVPLFLFEKNKRLKFMLVTGALSLFAMAFIISSTAFRERFVAALHTDLSRNIKYGDAVEPRLVRWEAAAGLITNSPVIGHGAGTEIGLLQDVFFNKKIYHAFLDKLNIHSQYLSFLIKSGIIGLAVYLATLFFGFKAAWQKRDLLFFSFMLLVALVSVSENLLDVDKGVMFYALFFSFFAFSSDGTRAGGMHNLLNGVATKQQIVTSL